MTRPLWALGLMSGTSLDGIDAALIRTDGTRVLETGPFLSETYDNSFRTQLRSLLGKPRSDPSIPPIADLLTRKHADLVKRLLQETDIRPDVIGFHGQTIDHKPDQRLTVQIGDGDLLAQETGIDVVYDLRAADVAAGGQGAPLASLYHAALAAELEKPLAVLNIGGVANVTWIGPDGSLLAFDTGPGNALIDDWMAVHAGMPFDTDGNLAAVGKGDQQALLEFLKHPYFALKPPKSLDRNDFKSHLRGDTSAADGAATLTAFTLGAVVIATQHFPAPVTRWLVCGGGRHNKTLMTGLAEMLGVPVAPVEYVGWQGDALEAQAFGFLAVRSLYGMPVTDPGTTGTPEPLTGGVLATA